MLRRSRRDGKNTQKNCTKKILINRISMILWSVTQRQTFWSSHEVKWASGGPAVNKASGCDGIPVDSKP